MRLNMVPVYIDCEGFYTEPSKLSLGVNCVPKNILKELIGNGVKPIKFFLSNRRTSTLTLCNVLLN